MRKLWIGALLALAACGTVTEEPQVFDILDFGAVSDGVTECTAAVQAAIDSCSLSGGGTVRVPEGTFLCRTLYLRDRVDLHLDKGALSCRGTASKGLPLPGKGSSTDVMSSTPWAKRTCADRIPSLWVRPRTSG